MMEMREFARVIYFNLKHVRSKDELLPYNLVCSLQSRDRQKGRERKSDQFLC